jgi:hypothetical protein
MTAIQTIQSGILLLLLRAKGRPAVADRLFEPAGDAANMIDNIIPNPIRWWVPGINNPHKARIIAVPKA